MTFVDKHEKALKRLLCFVFMLTMLFGATYSPLYIATADAAAISAGSYLFYPAGNNEDYITAEANSRAQENPDIESQGIVSINSSDIESLQGVTTWLNAGESYYFLSAEEYGCGAVNECSGHITPYFNVPNMQQNITTSLSSLFGIGGFASNEYKPYAISQADEEDVAKNGNAKPRWTTAAKKYGWSLPSNTYLGEKPSVTYDTSAVIGELSTPGNVINIVGTAIQDATFGNVYRFLTGDDQYKITSDISLKWGDLAGIITNLHYQNADYVENNNDQLTNRFVLWLYKNAGADWFGKDGVVKDGDVSSANNIKKQVSSIRSYYENQGASYVTPEAATIEDLSNSAPGIIDLKSWLVGTYGSNLGDLWAGFSMVQEYVDNGLPIGTEYLRFMPYDYNSMSSASKRAIGDVIDPRFSMWGSMNVVEGLMGSFGATVKGMLSSFVLTIVSFFCMMGAALNSICSLQFFSAIGFDFTMLWRGALGKALLIAFGAIIAIVGIKAIVKVIKGTTGLYETVGKTFVCLIALALTGALIAAPDSTSKSITEIASYVLDLGTYLTNNDDDGYGQLYSPEATQNDKSELRYWAIYFDSWSVYNTNHSAFGEEAQAFRPGDYTNKKGGTIHNEYVHLKESPAELSSSRCCLWSAIMLEYEFQGSNGVYRAVDHFMSPDWKPVTNESGRTYYQAVENQYNGDGAFIQSEIPWYYILISFGILVFTFIKVLFFLEFMLELFLFIVKIMSSAFDRSLKEPFKRIAKPLGKVVVMDLLLTSMMILVFKISSNAEGRSVTLPIIGILLVATVVVYGYNVYKHPDGFFVPEILKRTVDFGHNAKQAIGQYAAESAAPGSKTVLAAAQRKSEEAKRNHEANKEARKVLRANKKEQRKGRSGSTPSKHDRIDLEDNSGESIAQEESDDEDGDG